MKKWTVVGLTIVMATTLWAQAPEMFRYQGRLVNGTNLVSATLPMSFKLYDDQSGGNLVYEDASSVLVVDGLYSTMIGDDTISGSLADALTNEMVYLELTVDGETFLPRERLVSVPYSMNATANLAAFVAANALKQDVAVAETVLINAKEFGAVGDDSTDDTAALQAALDYAQAAKTPLFIPAGTYKITATLTNTMTSGGVIIRGAGETRTQIKQYAPGQGGIYINGNGTWESIRISDMQLTGYGRTGCGIKIEGGSATVARCIVSSVQVGNWDIGIYYNSCDQSLIMASATQVNNIGIKIDGNSNGINILSSVTTGNVTGGIEVVSGTGVNITGCDIGNGTTYAGDYMVKAGGVTKISGCSFEIHKDLETVILHTNALAMLTVDTCSFNKISAPSWTHPAINVGTYLYASPLVLINTRFSGLEGGTPSVRKWNQVNPVTGFMHQDNPTAGNYIDGRIVQTVTGTYPTPTSIVDNRVLSPFPMTWQDYSPGEGTAGSIMWKYSATTGSDDLLASYATSDSTWTSSSLLNKNMLKTVNTWTAKQTFTGQTDLHNTQVKSHITFDEAKHIVFPGSGYGNRIGNNANCRIRFFDTGTPAYQPAAVSNATDAASAITQLNALLSRLRSIGLVQEE